jgi:hypothetical protein
MDNLSDARDKKNVGQGQHGMLLALKMSHATTQFMDTKNTSSLNLLHLSWCVSFSVVAFFSFCYSLICFGFLIGLFFKFIKLNQI